MKKYIVETPLPYIVFKQDCYLSGSVYVAEFSTYTDAIVYFDMVESGSLKEIET